MKYIIVILIFLMQSHYFFKLVNLLHQILPFCYKLLILRLLSFNRLYLFNDIVFSVSCTMDCLDSVTLNENLKFSQKPCYVPEMGFFISGMYIMIII